MDLYMQVGLIFLLTTAFATLAFYNTDAMDRSESVKKTFAKESENYSLDSSITNPMFYVDARTFTQWAINARGQRDLYLVYSNPFKAGTNATPPNYSPAIKPTDSAYGAYLRELVITLDREQRDGRSLEVKPITGSSNNNAYLVNDQSPKTVDYLTVYSEEAKKSGTDKMVTVYTFSEEASGKTIYVAEIK